MKSRAPLERRKKKTATATATATTKRKRKENKREREEKKKQESVPFCTEKRARQRGVFLLRCKNITLLPCLLCSREATLFLSFVFRFFVCVCFS